MKLNDEIITKTNRRKNRKKYKSIELKRRRLIVVHFRGFNYTQMNICYRQHERPLLCDVQNGIDDIV